MKKIAIIGMGTMGKAIKASLQGDYEVIGLDQGDNLELAVAADIVIIAVKPQSFQALGTDLKKHIKTQTVLSIMAGISIKEISKTLNTELVVRTMPNLALAKAKSITGAYTLKNDQRQAADKLLQAWGQVVWLKEEADFNAFTALAGSGPAYFFEMVHQLQNAAEGQGIEGEEARRIAKATLISAAAMIDERSAAEMIEAVASKGGTTEAALSVFGEYGFEEMIGEAVAAATTRSKELSQ